MDETNPVAAEAISAAQAPEVSANEAPEQNEGGEFEGGGEGLDGLLQQPEDDTDAVEHEGGMQADPAVLAELAAAAMPTQPPMQGM
jgi:hypothetical protein